MLPREVLLGILVGGVCRTDPFSDQKRSFQFDTVFQTWSLKSIPVFSDLASKKVGRHNLD